MFQKTVMFIVLTLETLNAIHCDLFGVSLFNASTSIFRIKRILHCTYEGSSKSFRTFICSKKMERVGGVGVGSNVGCHVTSQQGKPVYLAVSVRVVTKR
jgi:hypothetical protein